MAPRLGPGPTLRVAQPCWIVKKGPNRAIELTVLNVASFWAMIALSSSRAIVGWKMPVKALDLLP
jgi:hypothetical protein